MSEQWRAWAHNELAQRDLVAMRSDLDDLVALHVRRHGATSKAVRALCAEFGWRSDQPGKPAEWYSAWQRWLGASFERALAHTLPEPRP